MARTPSIRFPGESPRYRRARVALLAAERELRRQVEAVARLRRRLPVGGRVPEDYVFEEEAGASGDDVSVRPVRLSGLFADGKEALALYSFMYGPDMKQPCSSCTSFLDSLNGAAPHARERMALAIVAKSPIHRIGVFARWRKWDNLRLLSSAGNAYNRDYHGEAADGGQMPMLNVFVRRAGAIHHFYGTELLFAPPERGQDPRHLDLMWPLWNLLDLTPEGRGKDWHPRLSYE